MKKKLITAYIAAALLFILGIAGTLLLLRSPDLNIVQIERDDEILYIFDLTAAQDQIIRIDYNESYNLVEIKDGRIRVKEAGCKDNTCVKMGWLSSSAPVVCLPNHLVIRFSSQRNEIDAVAG